MNAKYGVANHAHEVEVYLEPRTTNHAGPGYALIFTWGDGSTSSQNRARIFYLTPSSPDWNGARTQLGLPVDSDAHAKTLTHEYITLAHNRVSDLLLCH